MRATPPSQSITRLYAQMLTKVSSTWTTTHLCLTRHPRTPCLWIRSPSRGSWVALGQPGRGLNSPMPKTLHRLALGVVDVLDAKVVESGDPLRIGLVSGH